MQLDKLKIENFKLFRESEFSFHPEFNLVIGSNGSGKTSLLRAVSVALGGWAHAYIEDRGNRRSIGDDEIREIQLDKRFDKAKKVRIEAHGKAAIVDRFESHKMALVVWERWRSGESDTTNIIGTIDYGTGTKYNLKFEQLGHDILTFIESGRPFDLPLFAVYECDRLWLPKDKLNAGDSVKVKVSRFDPYIDCFHTGADHKAVGEWLLKHELASLQQKKDTPTLLSIRSAAKAALKDCSGLHFDFEESRVMVEFADGNAIPFEHLSDGQRTMLGLFCDLARRAAILNPHFGGEANRNTAGVVLIDELDLHLHPKWQRSIIDALRRTFPKIQFICTTHSPFLIQALRDGQLIRLGDNDDFESVEYHDQSIEDIVENIQGIELPQKSQRYQDMMLVAEKYYTLLRQARPDSEDELANLKNRLDELSAPFSDDPAYQALLKMERTWAIGRDA
jgi:predicted ATP-binding protein involved in virulence